MLNIQSCQIHVVEDIMINKVIRYTETKFNQFCLMLVLFAPPALLFMWVVSLYKASFDLLGLFCVLFGGLFFIFLFVSRLVASITNITPRTVQLTFFLQGVIQCILVHCMIYLELDVLLFTFLLGLVFLIALVTVNTFSREVEIERW